MSINVKQNGELTKIAGLYQTTAPIYIADCYSTEEKIVGCWTDGKPLYQKSFYATNVAITANDRTIVFTVSDLSSLSIDEVVGEVEGFAEFNDGANIITIPYSPGSATSTVCAYYDSTYGICIYRSGNGFTVNNLYLTIQYTKTTDTPGSGQWTPTGDIARHYSSQEHIIGTYEGETLYERTITHEGQLSNGFNSFLTVNDIKAMIGCELSVRNSSNNSWHNCSSSSSSSSMEVQIQIDANNVGSFGVVTSTTWKGPVVIATYRYTKITD